MISQEVPQGYKQTKVGVIPEDWEVVRLGDVFDFIKTYSNSRSHLSDIGDIEYLHYGDIHTKYKFHIDLSQVTLPKISKDNIKGEIKYVQEGDLIIADASEDYADIGKSVEVINIGDKKVISGLHTFLLRDKENTFADMYRGLFLYNQNISKEIKKIATGISVLGISKTNLGKILLPLPPLKEQQKIAQILTTWDRAIEKLEALIEEKERLKKGLMQKLLSGEVRFEGFDGEWEYKNADLLFETISNKDHNSDLPILAISQDLGAVPRHMINYKITATEKSISGYKVIEKGDFIISLRSFQGGIEYSNYKGICSPAYIILRPCVIIEDIFYKYYFKTHKYIQQLNSKLEGIRDGKMISYKYFSEIKIPFPLIEEQQKIAQTLTTADKEIELLKKELEALKEQKRGLMQRLLTGEVRV